MTNKELQTVVEGLLNDVGAINDFEYDKNNKNSVSIANFLLAQALENLREEIVTKARTGTRVFVPSAPAKKGKAEPKLPPTAVRALSIEDAA